MNPPVELRETREDLTAAEQHPAVDSLVSLVVNCDLLGRVGAIMTSKRPDRMTEFFMWLIDETSKTFPALRSRIVLIAQGMDEFFRDRGLHDEKEKIRTICALSLQFCVGRYLRQRLGNDLRRDVQVHINGIQVKPTGNNLDFGFAKEGIAEFLECKTKPWDLFHDGQHKPQLRLLLNLHKMLQQIGWDVVCVVPTFYVQSSAELPFFNAGLLGQIIPYGRDRVPDLAVRRPYHQKPQWQ